VGYNNPALLAAAQTPEFIRALMNRPALGMFYAECVNVGNFPPSDWADTLTESFLSVAPPGQTRIYTAMCGSCANETAYKV
jgi:4-aminobutyrate aminotransferase / (S)-3-amino-2-methylpropionate transaminase